MTKAICIFVLKFVSLNRICNKTSKLDQLNATMYKLGKVDATFFAKQAYGYDDNQRLCYRVMW